MTPEILEYLLRATAIWAVLLAYYFVSGRRESFRFQRVLLLGGWLFGLLVPLLPALAVGGSLPVASLPTASYVAPAFVVQAGEAAVENGWAMLDVLPWVYLLGVIVFGARTLVQWWFVEQCLRNGQHSSYTGYLVVRSEKVRSPFAARGYVFLPEQMPDAALENTALLHETSHLRARHHYDKLILTLGGIVLWFHPLVWVYRRLLATVHEYEADAAVLQSVPARTYGLQLLHCSLGPTSSLGLFSTPIQKRINMITDKTPTRRLRPLSLFTLSLLLMGLVMACSDVVAQETENADVIVVTNGAPADGITLPYYGNTDDPEASRKALLTKVYGTIKYPADARKSGTTGQFEALIYLDDNGRIEKVAVSESTGNPLGEEIVVTGFSEKSPKGNPVPEVLKAEIKRVLLDLDDFKPSTQKGKTVPSVIPVTVKFKLEI